MGPGWAGGPEAASGSGLKSAYFNTEKEAVQLVISVFHPQKNLAWSAFISSFTLLLPQGVVKPLGPWRIIWSPLTC